MNIIIAVVLTVCMWIFFSQIHQLKTANKTDGCCSKNSCGTSGFDKGIWNASLVVSIMLTIYSVTMIYNMNKNTATTRLY